MENMTTNGEPDWRVLVEKCEDCGSTLAAQYITMATLPWLCNECARERLRDHDQEARSRVIAWLDRAASAAIGAGAVAFWLFVVGCSVISSREATDIAKEAATAAAIAAVDRTEEKVSATLRDLAGKAEEEGDSSREALYLAGAALLTIGGAEARKWLRDRKAAQP